jgi:hypothetical protein
MLPSAVLQPAPLKPATSIACPSVVQPVSALTALVSTPSGVRHAHHVAQHEAAGGAVAGHSTTVTTPCQPLVPAAPRVSVIRVGGAGVGEPGLPGGAGRERISRQET